MRLCMLTRQTLCSDKDFRHFHLAVSALLCFMVVSNDVHKPMRIISIKVLVLPCPTQGRRTPAI